MKKVRVIKYLQRIEPSNPKTIFTYKRCKWETDKDGKIITYNKILVGGSYCQECVFNIAHDPIKHIVICKAGLNKLEKW